MPSRSPSDLLAALEEAAGQIPSGKIPTLLGELERLRTCLWARMVTPSADGKSQTLAEDSLLTVQEAAERLGVSPDYLYRHARKFPFTVRLGPRQLRFSSGGIDRYIRNRAGR